MTDWVVVYLMSGKAHLPYLVVSLYTLRKHWQGPINVFAWEQSFPIVQRIAKDEYLGISPSLRNPDPRYRGKNSQFIDKIKVMEGGHWGVGLYLDADTMVNGRLDHLHHRAETVGFCATQFGNWTSTSRMPRLRISRMLGREGIDQEHVRKLLAQTYPSVNGGVFACKPESAVLPAWHAQTTGVNDLFIADECVLHAMTMRDDVVVADGRYNCSTKLKPEEFSDESVKVWHFHGDSNVRQNKSPRGVYRWWPTYQHCLKENIGGMQEWIGEINNHWFNKLVDTPDHCCMWCGVQLFIEDHHKHCPDRGTDSNRFAFRRMGGLHANTREDGDSS